MLLAPCRNDGIDAGFKRTTISQRFGGALASAGLKGRTGDDDLPLREPLGERRAKYDAVRARQTAADDDHDGDDVLPGGADWRLHSAWHPSSAHSCHGLPTSCAISRTTVHRRNCRARVCAFELRAKSAMPVPSIVDSHVVMQRS